MAWASTTVTQTCMLNVPTHLERRIVGVAYVEFELDFAFVLLICIVMPQELPFLPIFVPAYRHASQTRDRAGFSSHENENK